MNNDKTKNKTKEFILKLSAILILIAACAYLFNPMIASYIMIVGVVGFIITTFMTPYPGKNIRGKRLYNMQVFGLASMAMSAYLMFKQYNEWVIPMLIAAILLSYTSIMLPRVYKKENEE